jgi:sortase (surface protein transpeptidase)
MRAAFVSAWRAAWDPVSQVLIMGLTSTVLAGLGVAMIMMGSLPGPAPGLDSAGTSGVPMPEAVWTVPESAAPRTGAQRRPVRIVRRSVPVQLDVPAIGVRTPLMSLGLQEDGTVEVPPLTGSSPAGWYRGLSSPGEAGPAVILGHVDSAKDGPAVFYRLKDLRRGDRISIDRADGSTVSFQVRSVARYPKKRFPTEAVYGPTGRAELRLVTCGGSFDRLRGHYRDNIVVYAVMTRALSGTGAARRARRPPSSW